MNWHNEEWRSKKIVVFGTGLRAKEFMMEVQPQIEFFVDNDKGKWGSSFLNYSVLHPNQVLSIPKNEVFIIIASMYYDEISHQLNEMDLFEGVHFVDSIYVELSMDVNENKSGSRIMYPKVVNYPITNKCNLRCAMCNVWKPEYAAKKDLTPAEIYTLFNKPLFKKLEHVGISGGEPFVRKDILEVIDAFCDALPSLKSVSIITNATLPWTVEKVRLISEKMKQKKLHFNLQISIDGVDEVHDANRGVAGTFNKLWQNFSILNQEGLVSEISTTVTKKNCHALWDVYQFARKNNVYIRFRLASSIDRLYNDDLVDNFMFSEEERLIIIKFFENINYYYEENKEKQFFYRSLIGQLKGDKRKVGCHWQTSEGVSLDPYGNLHYCFPKSKKIRNISSEEPFDLKLLRDNNHILEDALNHCDRCTHDYFGPMTYEGMNNYYESIVNERIIRKENDDILIKASIKNVMNMDRVNKVAIVGWYGTETLGDKAILGGIIDQLMKNGIALEQITLVSFDTTYSRLTLLEMGLNDVRLISALDLKRNVKLIEQFDMIMFGGGPLCDVEQLVDMLAIFMKARELGKRTLVYGCGIGPLQEERYLKACDKLLEHADFISLRDTFSKEKYSTKLSHLKEDVNGYIDPATYYLLKMKDRVDSPLINGEYVLFALRKWPKMYADGLSEEDYGEKQKQFEHQVYMTLKNELKKGTKIILFPMNNFYLGDDDREYYLQLVEQLGYPEQLEIITKDYTPQEAVNYFKYATFAFCMRFHSVVFAATCNTPFLALDYHYGQGKISGFMRQIGMDSYVLSMEQFIEEGVSGHKYVTEQECDWDMINKKIVHENNEMIEFLKRSLSSNSHTCSIQ
ncbi:polysaccharide pyruvyl transferase family protein [Marinicrinis sediminis]|uniref:Polysaccharide pyruvyl transferase family protein n=1 Tax=Marinicrinis sediminis TaxID=1652465 RepID=A0ABW5RBL3_9BACL